MQNFKIMIALFTVSLIAAQPHVQPEAKSLPAASLSQSAEALLGSTDGFLDMDQIKAHIKSFTAEGQEPMGAKAWVTTQLLPQVVQTAKEVQAEADRAVQAMNDCKSYLWSAEKEVAHRESILGQDESGMFKDIAMEHRLHKEEMDNCGDLAFVTDLVLKTKPKALSSLPANRTNDEIEAVLRDSQQFYADFFPKMQAKSSVCKASKQAALDAHTASEVDQQTIEAFYCAMKYGRDQACVEYAACYEEKSKLFDGTMTECKDLEAHTKQRFQKLTCFSRMDVESDAAPAACDSTTVNVAQLGVTYPSKPLKESCIHLMKTRRSYTDVSCKEGAVVTTTVAPTVAPVADSTTAVAN